MKRILFFILFITSLCLNAQTTFWTEGFGTGCNQLQLANGLNPGGNGTWTVSIIGAEDPQANTWYVSATENGNAVGACGTGCGTNQTLHVASIPNGSPFTLCPTGDCGASYDAGGTSAFGGTSTGTNKRVESPVINCTGHSTITLAFKYMENGQGATDDASLWYFDGTTWAQINALAKTVTCGSGQGKWTAFSMALPASANNNANVKIGFLWINDDDGAGTDPSFAVDDVTLTDAAAAANPVVSITPSPSATICITSTLTLNGSATNGPITSYSWTVNPATGATFVPNATTPTVAVTFSVAGTYTFNLAATNANGTGNMTQVITVTPVIASSVSVTASPSNPICPGTVV
ncbi:MAG: PKD domain-containing protein, partial [Bacteroidia bacterium]